MDIDLLSLALAERELLDCIQPGRKTEWERLRSEDFSDSFSADGSGKFIPEMCCDKHKKHDKWERRLFNKSSDKLNFYVLLAGRTACEHVASKKN